MPTTVEPMLAQLADRLPESPNWVYEIKWDGIRALCFVSPKSIEYRSRNGGTYTTQFPELSAVRERLKVKEAIFDGEIVALDDRGLSHFAWLQPRIARRQTSSRTEFKGRVVLILFDVLYADGRDLRSLPLSDRRKVLEAVVMECDALRISSQFQGEASAAMRVAEDLGLEGLMSKRVDGPYRAGRSADWLKVKTQLRQEFLICGWIEGKRKAFGSLVLGVHEGSSIRWCGNVGTGFSHKAMEDLRQMMEAQRTRVKPGGEWPAGFIAVKPTLVCEVKFAQWTDGGKLRAPVFLGLRADKQPQQVRMESHLRTG